MTRSRERLLREVAPALLQPQTAGLRQQVQLVRERIPHHVLNRLRYATVQNAYRGMVAAAGTALPIEVTLIITKHNVEDSGKLALLAS